MGFQIAELFASFTGDTSGYDRASNRMQSSLQQLSQGFRNLTDLAAGTFGSLAASAGLAVAAFAKSEGADVKLRASLKATGQETGGTADRLEAYAAKVERVTGVSKAAIENNLAFAASLGVKGDKLEKISTIGVGLGQSLFNGDTRQGIRAAALADEGNYRQLQRLIPALADAKNGTEVFTEVNKRAAAGLEELEALNKTTSGGLTQLGFAFQHLGEQFGAIIAPAVEKLTTLMRATVEVMQRLTPEARQHIVHWGEIAAGISGVVLLGPKIVGMFTGVTSTVLTLGKALVSVATGPIGLLIGGLAAGATAYAYFTGAGTTATQRIGSGFAQLGNLLDVFLGSAKGLWEGWEIVVDTTANKFLTVWKYVAYAAKTSWSTLSEQFTEDVDAWWTTIREWGVNVVNFFERLGMQIGHAWGEMTNAIGDELTKLMLMAQGMSGQDADAAIRSARKNTDAADEQAYQDKSNNFNGEWNKSLADMDRQWANRSGRRAADGDKERAKFETDLDSDLAHLDAERAKKDKDRANRMQGIPTFGGQLKGALDQLRAGMGIDDLLGTAKKIREQGEHLTAEALTPDAEKRVKEKKEKVPHEKEKTEKDLHEKHASGSGLARTGVEDEFKQQTARLLIGAQEGKDKAQSVREQQLDALHDIHHAIKEEKNAGGGSGDFVKGGSVGGDFGGEGRAAPGMHYRPHFAAPGMHYRPHYAAPGMHYRPGMHSHRQGDLTPEDAQRGHVHPALAAMTKAVHRLVTAGTGNGDGRGSSAQFEDLAKNRRLQNVQDIKNSTQNGADAQKTREAQLSTAARMSQTLDAILGKIGSGGAAFG